VCGFGYAGDQTQARANKPAITIARSKATIKNVRVIENGHAMRCAWDMQTLRL